MLVFFLLPSAQIATEQGAMIQGPITQVCVLCFISLLVISFSLSLSVAPQGEFLGRMGLVERLHQLAANLTSEDEVKDLIQSTEKVATGSMGNKFKFLSISHPSIKPPGFS